MAFVGAVLAMPLSDAMESLTEIDEIAQEKLPDGSLRVTFVTSGVNPSLAKIKTLIWAVFGLPVQLIKECNVETLQSGPIVKRFRITVTLLPALRARAAPAPGYIRRLVRGR
jgi:hypothetical protein